MKHSFLAIGAALFLLSACSQPTQPSANAAADAKAETPAPVETVTAKTALWHIYDSARHWTTDFVILKVEPKEIAGFKNEAGKAAMWEATLASPSRHESRIYSYSIADKPPDIFKGVLAGHTMPWTGETRNIMMVQLSDFQVDSDAAYSAAATDASAFLKKYPNAKLSSFELGNAYRFQAPIWYLQWGDKKLGYAVFVDATSGKPLKKG